MRTIRINGLEHADLHDALIELNFSGDRAISVGGRLFMVSKSEFRRIEHEGVQPTTWHFHEATGRIMSVPGRHG